MFSLCVLLFLVSLYLGLPIKPIFNLMSQVNNILLPVCLSLFWYAASSISGLALFVWYRTTSRVNLSKSLNLDDTHLMMYKKIFLCAFSVSFLSGFQLGWFIRSLRWLGKMAMYCASSFSEMVCPTLHSP